LNPDQYNIWAEAPDLTVIAMEMFEVREGGRYDAPDLKLIEGGFIEGRIVDAATQQPVTPPKNAQVSIYGPSRPKSGAAIESAEIKQDGTFRIRAAPGRNYIYLQPMPPWTPEVQSQWVEVTEGQTTRADFPVRWAAGAKAAVPTK
jgi:hypothetical protein